MLPEYLSQVKELVKDKMLKSISNNNKIEEAMAYSALADSKMIRAGLVFASSETNKNISKEIIPDTESLKDTYERVIKYFEEEIKKKLSDKNILISAHGNSIRALCKYLFKLGNNEISKLEIPTGNPLLIELDKNIEVKNCEYLDIERSKDLLVF